MNLEHHSTTVPPASDVDRVFDGSRLLQTGDLTDSFLREHTHDEGQSVFSHLTPTLRHTSAARINAAAPPHSSRVQAIAYRAFIALSGVALLLLAVGSPTTVQPPADQSVKSHFEARQRLEQASLAAISASKTAETWSGESKDGALYIAHVSALKTSGMLSVRLSVRGTLPESETDFVLRRAEADPVMLTEVEPRRWSGEVPLYLFLSRGDEFVSVVGEARVSISGTDAPVATLEVLYPATPKVETVAASHASELPPPSVPFQLSFTVHVQLSRVDRLTDETS